MKKIVICIPMLATAGAERFVVDLATHLDREKYKVYVAITRVNEIKAFGDVLNKNNIEIVNLVGDNFFKSIKKQVLFLKKVKPDVVHTNIGSLFHIMVASKLVGIRTRLFTIHNEAQLLYENSKIRKLMYRLAFRVFGFTPVAICESVKQSMIHEFGKQYRDIPCINNGVDIVKFKPNYQKAEKEYLTIINTGTMYWIKNQRDIIEAFSMLLKKYNNIRLVILGDGEERKKLELSVKEKGLIDVVYMPGICTNVNEYLKNADIYVSASLTEGLPLSMLEAMASGLPIVTSDAGGSVDLVKSEINGIIYSKGEVNALKEALETLIINEEKRLSYANNSRKIAEQWSIENCVSGYEALYNM